MRRYVVIALSLVPLAGCGQSDCRSAECALSSEEFAMLSGLANLGPPPPDPSNHLIGDPVAIELGRQFFFDPGFSGKATQIDVLEHDVPYAAHGAKKGDELRIACADCHDLHRGGADTRSVPNHISVGAGWSPVNALSIVNAAYYRLPFRNGREDSLWGMIPGVVESPLAMGGNRMRVVWRISDFYAEAYERLFPPPPDEPNFPYGALTRNDVLGVMAPDGTCLPDPNGATCAQGCSLCGTKCYPTFPPDGKPGAKSTCERDVKDAKDRALWNDAYDCMGTCADSADGGAKWRNKINHAFVNFAKIIEAYEYQLVSRDSRFDRFMRGEVELDDAEIRGARLFVGKAACSDCHNTPLFSDNRYYNTGVPEIGEAVPTVEQCYAGNQACDCTAGTNKCLPFGRYDGAKRLKLSKYVRTSTTFSSDPSDDSRDEYFVDPTDDMKGAWRTQSLREIALTGPYMHNGSLKTLEDVVAFYDWGGSSAGTAPENKSANIRPLFLGADERNDLVAFLGTLTGDPLPDTMISAPQLPDLD